MSLAIRPLKDHRSRDFDAVFLENHAGETIHLERHLKDYADDARKLGVTRARMTPQ